MQYSLICQPLHCTHLYLRFDSQLAFTNWLFNAINIHFKLQKNSIERLNSYVIICKNNHVYIGYEENEVMISCTDTCIWKRMHCIKIFEYWNIILAKVKITSNLSVQKKYLEKSNSVKIQLYQDETVIGQENLLYVLRHLRKETISLNMY